MPVTEPVVLTIQGPGLDSPVANVSEEGSVSNNGVISVHGGEYVVTNFSGVQVSVVSCKMEGAMTGEAFETLLYEKVAEKVAEGMGGARFRLVTMGGSPRLVGPGRF